MPALLDVEAAGFEMVVSASARANLERERGLRIVAGP